MENIDIDSLIEISCLNEIDSFDNTKELSVFQSIKKLNRKIAVVMIKISLIFITITWSKQRGSR